MAPKKTSSPAIRAAKLNMSQSLRAYTARKSTGAADVSTPSGAIQKKSKKSLSPRAKGEQKRKVCSRWTSPEKELLCEAIKIYGEKSWNDIAKFVGTKDSDQCNQHWHRVLNPNISKHPWSAEEDAVLSAGIEEYGESSWKRISESLPGRTDIQCRHRWIMLKKLQEKTGKLPTPSTSATAAPTTTATDNKSEAPSQQTQQPCPAAAAPPISPTIIPSASSNNNNEKPSQQELSSTPSQNARRRISANTGTSHASSNDEALRLSQGKRTCIRRISAKLASTATTKIIPLSPITLGATDSPQKEAPASPPQASPNASLSDVPILDVSLSPIFCTISFTPHQPVGEEISSPSFSRTHTSTVFRRLFDEPAQCQNNNNDNANDRTDETIESTPPSPELFGSSSVARSITFSCDVSSSITSAIPESGSSEQLLDAVPLFAHIAHYTNTWLSELAFSSPRQAKTQPRFSLDCAEWATTSCSVSNASAEHDNYALQHWNQLPISFGF